jgi:hypothetical protein
MMRWPKIVFAFRARTAATLPAYYDLPANAVMEPGAQVQFRDLFLFFGNFTQRNKQSPYRQTALKKEQYQYSADHTFFPPYY